MKVIITNNPNGYNEKRNIFSQYSANFVYKKDVFDLGLKISHRLTKKGYHPFWKGLYYNPKDQMTECVFFNTINLGKNSWRVYFETKLPRLGNVPKFFYDIAVKQLAKDNCKEIIAISQCAYELQLDYLKSTYPNYYDIIKEKMVVKLPPQPPLIENYNEKFLPKNKIVFTIVGTDFFRKGGREILKVFNELIPKYSQLQLNIISSMNYGDYATHTTKEDYNNAIKIIEKFPENIKHYIKLENSEVLDLFKNTHVGLLPTWADSFGYSVLEAQATGCPVITTDIRALPEINNNKIGWIIEVPKIKSMDADIISFEKRELFSCYVTEQLYQIVTEICKQPEILKDKSYKSLKTIKTRWLG
ncbi:glycosyltransferase family 4 protein [Algoriphagus hitonicola]|uniref:Glycosyl transferases group 1 n=1 Tax=Algoriphagus hitonicola TaxID=435880 RepID=A0A1I2XTJ3_9BACT|nr:glycosyltransferase family 4 protein [Algoriphagus hitonicola]SFH16036.1 Glycosyl transferases group 1 [Algoriphagus hitonicola]